MSVILLKYIFCRCLSYIIKSNCCILKIKLALSVLIYIIFSGKGKASIDGEDVEIAKGDVVKISPEGKRQFFAADDSELSYACIQVKAGSIEGYTADDAVVY